MQIWLGHGSKRQAEVVSEGCMGEVELKWNLAWTMAIVGHVGSMGKSKSESRGRAK